MKPALAILCATIACVGCAHTRRGEKSSAVDAELAKHSMHDSTLAHTTGPGGATARAAGREARSYDATLEADGGKSKRGWFMSERKANELRLTHDLAQAESLAGAGKLGQARDIYQRLVVEFPKQPQALHGLALVADRQRKHREAQALYVQALALKPREAAWLSDLGWSYYLDGQMDKAESALAKAVLIAPAEPRYHNNLGLVLGQQRKYAPALDEFRKAGSEADAQYNLAFVLSSQDDVAGAKRCFQLALASDPSYGRARDALRAFEQYEQDPKAGELAALDRGNWVPFIEDPAAAGSVGGSPHLTGSTAAMASGAGGVAPVSYNANHQTSANLTAGWVDAGGTGPASFGTAASVRSPIEGIHGSIGRALPKPVE